VSAQRIDPALIESFGRTIRESLTTGSTPFRKAYLRSLIDVIEVDDEQIRIKDSKDVVERAVVASRSGVEPRSQFQVAHPTRFERVTFTFGGQTPTNPAVYAFLLVDRPPGGSTCHSG
jgi:hypothetical protein